MNADDRDDVIDFEQMQALRSMGAPLDTPVEDREFSPEACKLIENAFTAALAFRKPLMAYSKKNNGTNYLKLKIAFEQLRVAVGEAMEDGEPRYVQEPNGGQVVVNVERVAVAALVASRELHTACAAWRDIFDLLDSGRQCVFTLDGIMPRREA